MNKTTTTNPGVDKVLAKLKETETQLGTIAKECSQVRKALKKALDDLDKTSWPVTALESLLETLNKPNHLASGTELDGVIRSVEIAIGSIKQGFEHDFRNQLKLNAEQQGIAYGTSGDNVTIGPFELIVDRAKNLAELSYAKAPFITGLPLDAKELVQASKDSADELLQTPPNLAALCKDLEEAVFVAIARERKSNKLPELRAELPTVYREMTFIRQVGKKPLSKRSFRDYPLARFVVEVASVIRSDENVSADRSFRLETAVLENTGNQRKSVFIPKDLKKGYGEGMYYQAILLRQPT